jgi:two-component system phosphate regulon sensor histidine kinase PhoR
MVFSGLISKGILSPMRQLYDSIHDYLGGEDTTFHMESKYEETEEIALAFSELAKRINRYISSIKEEQEKSSLILDNIQEGLMVLDRDQDVLLANAAALRIFGRPGPPGSENIIYYTRDPKVMANIGAAFRQHKNTYFDHEDRNAGKTYRFHLSFVSEDAFGKSGDGLLMLITDKTEAALADKVRYDFAANVSHELKTPLTSIIGYAQLISNGMAKDENTTQKYAQYIIGESDRLMGLINDTLALSELENIRIDETTESVDLAEEARHVKNMLSSKAGQKEVGITVSGGAEMTANKNRIRQLLLNLCDNAIKYSGQGGEVSVALQQAGGQVTVTVKDKGIGIPEEELNRVFERFYRAKNAGGATVPGTGLGLAIVKHIAQLYGGEVLLRSAPGEGSEFVVRMRK